MARKLKVDFTGVESYQRVSEGVHPAKISDIQEKTSQGGDSMLQIAFEVTAGDDKGNRVFDNIVLTDKALWKFKGLLQALNMKCDSKVVIDLDSMIGKSLEVTVIHEEYNGTLRAKVSEFNKLGKSASVDEDDEDADFDDEDEDEEEEAPAPKKKSATAKKAPAKKKPEPEPEEDEEDDLDEDEDDEEEEVKPAPKKKAATKKPATKKAAPKKKPEPEEDEDDEDDDDDWEED